MKNVALWPSPHSTIKVVIVLCDRGLHPPVCEPLLLPPLVADDSSQSVLPILSRRLRGHLIKRGKSYAKENRRLWRCGLKYTSTGLGWLFAYDFSVE